MCSYLNNACDLCMKSLLTLRSPSEKVDNEEFSSSLDRNWWKYGVVNGYWNVSMALIHWLWKNNFQRNTFMSFFLQSFPYETTQMLKTERFRCHKNETRKRNILDISIILYPWLFSDLSRSYMIPESLGIHREYSINFSANISWTGLRNTCS